MFHLARHRRTDWPIPGAVDFDIFFEGWARAFEHRRVRAEEADAASERLMRDPPPYVGDHLSWLLELIDERRCGMQNHNPRMPEGPPVSPEEKAIVRQIVATPQWWLHLGKEPETSPRPPAEARGIGAPPAAGRPSPRGGAEGGK